jgi:phosphoglycolate phosphatase-like HAD superfamily hydrolase
MVGDSTSDVEAGLSAGVKRTILIGSEEKEPREGVWTVGTFAEAVEFILVQELKQSQKPDQSGN